MGASPAGAALPEASFSCLTGCMAEEAALAEEAACLELTDLLFQGLPLLLGWGIAVAAEEDVGGETDPEVAAEVLVEGPAVTADDGTCSLIPQGCEVIPSEESAGGHGHLRTEVLFSLKIQL